MSLADPPNAEEGEDEEAKTNRSGVVALIPAGNELMST